MARGGGGGLFFYVCAEKTGRLKNCLGECSLKVTRRDCECFIILVSNPESSNVPPYFFILP